MPHVVTLDQMSAGQSINITEIEDSPRAAELMHLGFIPGQRLTLNSNGRTLIVDVRRTRIALDVSMAQLIRGVTDDRL